ncbi:MAG TPA: hypothetical protein VNC82_19400 [Candidatus Limnocylindria bacterium]|nr:hypothetical protein [Candidatus Limnocylindria bacterium]
MNERRILAMGMALLFAGCASSSTGVSNVDAAKVRVVNDAKLVSTCQVLGTVADNEFEDLQKKAARLGGDVALLTPERKSKGGYFGLQDYMTADVYRCGR